MTTKKRRRPIPTVRKALELCKARGWTGDIVERYNRFSRQRNDLFGFIDMIVLADGKIVGVQCCSGGGGRGSDAAAHRTKIENEPRSLTWLRHGGRIELWVVKRRKIVRGGVAFKFILDRYWYRGTVAGTPQWRQIFEMTGGDEP